MTAKRQYIENVFNTMGLKVVAYEAAYSGGNPIRVATSGRGGVHDVHYVFCDRLRNGRFSVRIKSRYAKDDKAYVGRRVSKLNKTLGAEQVSFVNAKYVCHLWNYCHKAVDSYHISIVSEGNYPWNI